MANESVIIDIIPTIPDGLIHGQEVPYGWAVRKKLCAHVRSFKEDSAP